ncbi:MAG TPA: CopD family protein, partial [bacterium]|nr:CopD family protein [bacterium]
MYQVSVFLHLVAATVWVGGLLFLALVAVPVARGLPPGERASLIAALGRRFLPVAWAALAALVVTGFINLGYRGVTWESAASGHLFAGSFGRILAVKLVLVVAALTLSALHDFVLGPASSRPAGP